MQDCVLEGDDTLTIQKELREFWKSCLGPTSEFGLFCNPDIGMLFIAGSLVSQFLHDMDGKTLGEMHSVPYGILRGLGITEKNASKYLKELNESYFLLLIRGYDYELDTMESLVINTE